MKLYSLEEISIRFFKICKLGLLLTVRTRHLLNSVSELALVPLCESKFPIGTIKTTWCRLSGQLVELIASPSRASVAARAVARRRRVRAGRAILLCTAIVGAIELFFGSTATHFNGEFVVYFLMKSVWLFLEL